MGRNGWHANLFTSKRIQYPYKNNATCVINIFCIYHRGSIKKSVFLLFTRTGFLYRMLYEEALENQKVPDFNSWLCQIKEHKGMAFFLWLMKRWSISSFLTNAYTCLLWKNSKYKNRLGIGFLCKTRFSYAKIDGSRHMNE